MFVLSLTFASKKPGYQEVIRTERVKNAEIHKNWTKDWPTGSTMVAVGLHFSQWCWRYLKIDGIINRKQPSDFYSSWNTL